MSNDVNSMLEEAREILAASDARTQWKNSLRVLRLRTFQPEILLLDQVSVGGGAIYFIKLSR